MTNTSSPQRMRVRIFRGGDFQPQPTRARCPSHSFAMPKIKRGQGNRSILEYNSLDLDTRVETLAARASIIGHHERIFSNSGKGRGQLSSDPEDTPKAFFCPAMPEKPPILYLGIDESTHGFFGAALFHRTIVRHPPGERTCGTCVDRQSMRYQNETGVTTCVRVSMDDTRSPNQ
ncbi:hypothetical protein Q31b_49660 [Novipirellula aureliae]|uniref:Uncharacterized protein n=1 Tax=Novipirellula aureliae TaxID=2527966 RepID=A0A5C6DKR5_9BACT|nr:hypothetical protein Q31b_49660 [Novipirellula aureliae]